MGYKHPKLVKQIILDHKAAQDELATIQEKYGHIFKRQQELRDDLRRLHEFARFAAGDSEPCPIHNLHHNERKSKEPSRTEHFIEEALRGTNRPLMLAEVTNYALEAGWKTRSMDAANVIRATLNRMEKRDLVIREADGYRLRAN